MKKIIVFVVTVALVLSLSACKPDNTSDGMYQIGLNVLKITDQYINGDIGTEEAAERVKEYSRRIESEKKANKAEGSDSFKFSNDLSISIYVTSIEFDLSLNSSMTEIMEDRDHLAKALGK